MVTEHEATSKIPGDFVTFLSSLTANAPRELAQEDLDYWNNRGVELKRVLRCALCIKDRYKPAVTPVSDLMIEFPPMPPFPSHEELERDWPFIVRVRNNHCFTDRRVLGAIWSFERWDFVDWAERHPEITGAFGYSHAKWLLERREGPYEGVTRLFQQSYDRPSIVFPGTIGFDVSEQAYMPIVNVASCIMQWRKITDDTVPQWVAVGKR